ncbi:MAG: HEAT repeat domain-containing protein [Pseudomonadota bacterium]
MRSFRFPMLAAVALVAIMGAWALLGRDDGEARSAAGASMPSAANDRDTSRTNAAADSGQHRRTRASDADLRELMRRYAAETELDKRGALLAILQANPNEEVKAFALALAASRDPAARQEGLELLKAFPLDDAKVRGFLVGQIDQEQDPAMLTKLVDMLSPTMVATEDAAPLVAQLARLREHPDPEVRAASILQSSQWDRGGDLENTLHSAMLDPDPRVRQAAIGGISAERVRSDRLKDMLLAIASDPKTGAEERNRAIFALEGFALNRAEYEVYRQAGRMGEGEDGHGH